MIKHILSIFLVAISVSTYAQTTLDYYLPENVTYDQSIPTPQEIIGHEVGEWHITHDRLVYYMRAIADASPRIAIEEFGQTHEGRPQALLIVTSPENHSKLDEIKAAHKRLTDPSQSGNLSTAEMPVVVLQGFSIHGNEPSGSNASMLTAYHYAAAKGDEIDELLDNSIILLDPSFNPDGLTRFSTWANSRRSKNLVADGNNMEQNEQWPRGRTNHYWFDLNRDWLPVQQPEARNRIAKFHEWKPNVLTDHHEMGTYSTFFFQPGIPSRVNPNTPKNNITLTEKIGTYHAKALDKIGSLYYSEEDYDDFYYGKGSTFPDINGAVGILFEQASSRGHAQESPHGILKFPFTIKNQFVTSLSTTEAALALRTDLLEHQRSFYKDAISKAGARPQKGVVFGSENDAARSEELANIMIQHEIEVYRLGKDMSLAGTKYPSRTSFFVPFDQAQYNLINIMFEKVTTFEDSLFYDVSAWTLPMAFGLNHSYLTAKQIAGVSKGEQYFGEAAVVDDFEQSNYAYAFSWDEYYAPRLLWKLLQEDIICKTAFEPFSLNGQAFNRGSILIPVQIQESPEKLHALLSKLQVEEGIKIFPLNTGATVGVDLGSRTFYGVDKPKIALLVEEGVSSYDAGEVWHLLDNRFDMEVSLVPIRVFNRMDLNRYNTIVMVNGSYGSINGSAVTKLKAWIQNGGKVIAFKRANSWLKSQEIIKLETVASDRDKSGPKPYALMNEYTGAQRTGGAIFSGKLDLTNPIGFGYTNNTLPVFVNSNTFFKAPSNPYAYPYQFSSNPLESGYVSEENLERIKNSAGVIVSRSGSGRIISFSFNTNFRAFWYGTNKLFLNAIYYGHMVSSGASSE
ncbi:MAG: zinc carboxypeptidase [Cyclobacteriaceae bacterium]